MIKKKNITNRFFLNLIVVSSLLFINFQFVMNSNIHKVKSSEQAVHKFKEDRASIYNLKEDKSNIKKIKEDNFNIYKLREDNSNIHAIEPAHFSKSIFSG